MLLAKCLQYQANALYLSPWLLSPQFPNSWDSCEYCVRVPQKVASATRSSLQRDPMPRITTQRRCFGSVDLNPLLPTSDGDPMGHLLGARCAFLSESCLVSPASPWVLMGRLVLTFYLSLSGSEQPVLLSAGFLITVCELATRGIPWLRRQSL